MAAEWELPEGTTLAALAAAAPPAWKDILLSHLAALGTQTRHIKDLRDANEQFLRAASRSSQETIATMQREPGVYNSFGRSEAAPGSASLLDQKL